MVKHIVLYTFKEGIDKDDAVKLIASVLEPLVGKIPACSIWKSAGPSMAWTMRCILNSKAGKP